MEKKAFIPKLQRGGDRERDTGKTEERIHPQAQEEEKTEQEKQIWEKKAFIHNLR
jgi:hypothetical protein